MGHRQHPTAPKQLFSREENPHRSGSCQYCDVSLRSRKMTGPLTCTECRQLMEYDKQLEEENLWEKGAQERRILRHNTQDSVSALLLINHDQQLGESTITQLGESDDTPIVAEEAKTGDQEHGSTCFGVLLPFWRQF